ncbi:acetyltransferase [Clostridium sp. TW13]|uniref:Acetyltransferase n=1 Tax=Inconstantimicrobium mannanitabidum TaxID=1604901 RepID=A0ACB5RE48_9CLOT|nr:acyltransferase [Clostridium sp. TW13]GKX67545.1 acetyltransferase [Clostridium sp. TW13]
MNLATIKVYVCNPRSLIKTFWYSLRFTTRRFLKFPIRSSWKGKIRLSIHKCKLNIKGNLRLGITGTRVGEMGQVRHDLTLIQIAKGGSLDIDGDFTVEPGARIIVGPHAKMVLGNNSFISVGALIISRKLVEIGENCAISWNVQIMDTDFHTICYADNSQNTVTKPVKIGDNVWICSNVSILKGVTIGDGAVIGANSIVTKDVPPNTLVSGNPAKVIKENVKWKL